MSAERLGLGIDAGGTQTRWALATAGGDVAAEGSVAGLSALQLTTPGGREQMQATLAKLSAAVLATGRPDSVCAGITGLDDERDEIMQLIAAPLGLAATAVMLKNDIEIACLDLFAPGEGYVVYAGTGSIAAFLDADGVLHRAGGRGVLLDDAGGGFWIAREALQHIWRREDERPGRWAMSPMAVEIFARIGGSEWSHSRRFFYSSARGDIGKLALAVAATAEQDAVARDILQRAGRELARLGDALLTRFGPRPMALSGRAAQLHPLIESGMRDALGSRARIDARVSEAHLAAARIAARMPPISP